jgi:hypothetical protein
MVRGPARKAFVTMTWDIKEEEEGRKLPIADRAVMRSRRLRSDALFADGCHLGPMLRFLKKFRRKIRRKNWSF